MVQPTAPFAKGQLRANVIMESVCKNARLIGLFELLIIDRARPQSGHPSRPARAFLCKGILAWEDELPSKYSAVNAVFASSTA